MGLLPRFHVDTKHSLAVIHCSQIGFDFVEYRSFGGFIIPALIHKLQISLIASIALFWYVRSEWRCKSFSNLNHHI